MKNARRLLGDVCQITMGQAPEGSSYNEEAVGLPLIAGAGDFGSLTPKPKKFTSEPSKVSSVGDIILCIRATIGDTNWSDREYCLGRGVAGLRAEPGLLDQNFLWHFISARRHELENKGVGSTFKQVSKNDISGWEIYMPSLSEQAQIAALLDKAENLRRKRGEAIRLADEFLRSVFIDIFGNPSSNNRQWPERTIFEIAIVTTGNTPSRDNDAYYGNFIEWIKSDNINTASHWLTPAREKLSELGASVGRAAPAGSTLMTCIAGSASCIGNVAMTDRKVAFNQQINALTPRAGIAPEFLYSLLLFSKARIQSVSTNSMKGMVSKGVLEQIPLIYPPEKLQMQFVEIFHRVQKLRSRMEVADASSLLAALQAKLLA